MPPPPPPTVTGLQPASAGPLCPGKTVEFKASTSPSNATVTWTIAVNGGEPQAIQGDGNTLRISGASGQTIVVTASLTNSRSATARWKVADLKVDVPPGPNNGRYVITDEPRMPVVTATAVGVGGPASDMEWEVSAAFTASDCPPFGPHDLRTVRRFSRTGGNEVTTDVFGDEVWGGGISFHAKGVVNGCSVSAFGGAGLVGTNPQRTAIQKRIEEAHIDPQPLAHTLGRIACKESGQRQFDAPPNGGTGYCPLFGPEGKVGIMQILKQSDDEIWNWTRNVDAGIQKFKKLLKEAQDYGTEIYSKSEQFGRLVEDLNKKRQQQGLDPIDVKPREFNLEELEKDVIRGYDGWNGADGYGFTLHEYKVAVDRVDGKEILVVTNVNEQTLQGEAIWRRVPAADRPAGSRRNYVEEVLAFNFDCTASTVSCNLTGINPNTATLFIVKPDKFTKPSEFTAEGTGLADVKWRAPGGSPATGTGPTFTTRWPKFGTKTVKAMCGHQTKTATVRVLQVEIHINNPRSTKDGIVQLKSDHPDHRFTVPCTIGVRGAADPLDVVLTSQNNRLGFVAPLGFMFPTMPVKLPKTGNLPFEITGEKASSVVGDAKITAKLTTTQASVVAEKNVTVFSFDQAKILVTQGANYELHAGLFRPNGVAVNFEATVRLRPEGLDCNAPQLKRLRIAIMQEVLVSERRVVFKSPEFEPIVDPMPKMTVQAERTVWYDVNLEAPPAVSDSNKDAKPLYSKSPSALKPPIGCPGAGSATSNDSPYHQIGKPPKRPEFKDGRQVGWTTWPKIDYVTWNAFFRTFCVVIDLKTQKFCALRQTTWKLELDSRQTNQHAIARNDDDPASVDPTMPPPFAIDADDRSYTYNPPFDFFEFS